MGILSSLKRSQKEAVGLLQIGTFLEYFDLMLYVHIISHQKPLKNLENQTLLKTKDTTKVPVERFACQSSHDAI